jgi:molecular chaperone DnaJ
MISVEMTYVFWLKVNPHPFFRREGLDIHVDVPISLSMALLGGTVTVPTLTGEVEVKVPPGIQPGEKRVLRGRGIKKSESEVGNQVRIKNIINIEE